MAKKDSTEVAVTETAKVGGLAAFAYDREDAGAGFEGIDQSELQIPFFVLLQKNSKQCEEDSGKYIVGAKAGMYLNSVTGDLFDGKTDGLPFIPVHREHKFNEWIPRDEGGGLVAVHDPLSEIVTKTREGLGPREDLITSDGNQLIETFNVYGLHVKDLAEGIFDPGIISFAKTFIGPYKNWMTKARSIQQRDPETNQRITPPLFSHVYLLKAQFSENKRGSWYKPLVGFLGGKPETANLPKDHELYQAAKGFRDLVTSGAVKPVNPSPDSAGGDEPGGNTDKF
jgi:hypothetical protein